MKFVLISTLLSGLFFSLITSAAPTTKTFSIKNLKVEKQEEFSYDGSQGVLVKFKGVKKEVYFPRNQENQESDIFSALERAENSNRSLSLKLSRVNEDIVIYRASSLTEVLSIGGDCEKIMKKTKSPRLFCNKGYQVRSVTVK